MEENKLNFAHYEQQHGYIQLIYKIIADKTPGFDQVIVHRGLRNIQLVGDLVVAKLLFRTQFIDLLTLGRHQFDCLADLCLELMADKRRIGKEVGSGLYLIPQQFFQPAVLGRRPEEVNGFVVRHPEEKTVEVFDLRKQVASQPELDKNITHQLFRDLGGFHQSKYVGIQSLTMGFKEDSERLFASRRDLLKKLSLSMWVFTIQYGPSIRMLNYTKVWKAPNYPGNRLASSPGMILRAFL